MLCIKNPKWLPVNHFEYNQLKDRNISSIIVVHIPTMFHANRLKTFPIIQLTDKRMMDAGEILLWWK